MRFKCPVCNAVIAVTDPKLDSIECTQCHSSFNLASIRKRIPQRDQATTQITADANVPETSESRQPNESFQVIDSVSGIQQNSAALTVQQKKKSRRRAYLLSGLLIAVAAVAIGLIFVIQSQPSEDGLVNGETTIQGEGPISKIELPEIRKTDLPDFKEMQRPFFALDQLQPALPKPGNRIIPQTTIDDNWFLAKPHLVELHAVTPQGAKFATGVIVDSRGWVVTSYRAVEGANIIYLRPARNDVEETYPDEADRVAGIIAAAPEHDLVLLSISRRWVESFEDLDIDADDKVVESEYLVQCVPPTNSFDFRAFESRVSRRKRSQEYPVELAGKFDGLNMDPGLRWIEHRVDSVLFSGAPLLNQQGKLVGINSSIRFGDEKLFAVPSRLIRKLKSKANGKVKSLPVPDLSLTSSSGAGKGNTGGSSLPVISSASANRPVRERLNLFGMKCEAFLWMPRNSTEHQELMQFANTISELRDLDDLSQEDQSQVANQKEIWLGKMEQAFGQGAKWTRAQQIEFNQQQLSLAKGNDPICLGFVFVKYSAMESPRIPIDGNEPADTVILEFKGSQQSVIANVKSEWPALPPDSPWFVLGTVASSQVTLMNREEQREQISMAKLDVVFRSN